MPIITRLYHFEAAHYLPKVPEGHRCRKMHGHNYEFEVAIMSGWLNECGFVMDFWDLDEIVQDKILVHIDHTTLNDIEGLENPTAEIISAWILSRLQDVFQTDVRVMAVRLWETKTCSAIAYG